MNAVEIEAAVSDLALQPFDGQEFPFAFLAAFGNKDTALKRLRTGNNNTSDVPGGVLQRNNIHIAVCEADSVGETLKALRTSPATTKAKAKFILATDGQTLEAEELASGETIACAYADFPNHFGFLLPLAGISTIKEIKDNPIDVRATSRLNKLYVELLNENPEWAKEGRRADMNHFMARLVFCFFAEDTDIFNGNGLFTQTVEQMSERDGANTHEVLSEIFRAMNIKVADRANAQPRLPNWANGFPYVNGGLFSGSTETPRFTRMARTYLIHAGNLNWQKINPDIFGSMIQAVADDEERGALGMHYTSVPNILKVLNPLFLDDLRAALDEAADNERKLLNLRKRMARIRVFDPACGSGNFLVIAYKQMREIEAEINRRRGELHLGSEIPLTNFRGIELRDFPAEIARLALIIAEFQCDVLYRGQKDALAEFLPLDAQNWIVCGNALRLDWLNICPPTGTGVKIVADDLFGAPLNQTEIDFENEGGETYICGNPPYLGAKKKSKLQSDDMEAVGLGEAQLLDYVAAFIIKGLDVIEATNTAMALVSTSSICQGEQVSLIWPKIFAKAAIAFAYRPFKWANSAANNAGVFCTIIGLVKNETKSKSLFDGEILKQCESISPYLIPGPKIYCSPESMPISLLSQMKMGSNSVDGKRLILENGEAEKIVANYPEASMFIRLYGGTKEMVSGSPRRCIWIEDQQVEVAKSIPPIRDAIEECHTYRISAGRDARKAAVRPHSFCYSTYEDRDFIQVGNTIGGALAFVPADIKKSGFVSNHNAFVVYGAPLVEFSIIVSTLHKVWAETIAGRLGDGIRYGNTVVYNTFPLPLLTELNKADLTTCAENILLAREAHFPATIADLYDPVSMPDNLRRAHECNDEVLERIYIGRRFKNDTERLEKLFELYTNMTAAAAKTRPTTKAPRGKNK
ncbi:class I SAM-dependent DNA methyltransferase [Undibacterium griseum]|uniref:site-specific DNA-methyltransferase (adenine-specific) n=1 Tax=Undibacterium griseum TaxID=2762295 RepID=A0ABR6YM20_9BURK|nr:class I SAM-dependent DNA methyltransferase [Undibacterium griseum]MBC3884944.1 class I SAM-dependent DNA methyltransferase [Undibacterium griseum]